MFKLVIQDDEGKTTVVPLIRDEITIGRKEGNTIRLTERNVSRRHARIVRSNGEVQIEDLGSYNGIRVNNARIAERVSLRISDQVQIGDYKLYLKAEGVEQVDDARTMPIERQGLVGDNGTPVVDVAAATHTPTAPIPVTPPPAQRASLAVADTDPAGRPVATAAQVAALSATAGYGKLVVMSSNFAGKEFELTRPQMIVGRTDENDLVVNHRSISRNHAKVTRDPETQRYTISDLQSSNGVRVNGQDYGKVELRRGDIVDLGHVRLRFVEPGEEFVFTPAMIADIPDAGGRKGLMVAIILAIVVLGAVGAFFVFKHGGDSDKDKNGSNPQGSNDGSAVAIGSNPTQPEHGSNAVVIAEQPDANEGTTNPSNNDAEIKRISSECMSDVTDRKWDNVAMCADSLAKLDPKAADKFKKQAHAETANENIKSKLDGELANNNLKAARKLLDQLPDESVYHNEAVAKVDAAESKIVDDFRARAQKAKRENRCKDIDVMITQASQASGKAGDAVRAFKCEAAVIAPPPVTDCTQTLRDANDKKCVKQFCADHKDDSHCPQQAANNPPPAGCNADELREAGTNSEAMGAHAQAVKQFEQALQCKSDPHTIQLTFMASCNAHNAQKAKVYWKRMSVDAQNRVVSMCIRNGIDRTALDAP